MTPVEPQTRAAGLVPRLACPDPTGRRSRNWAPGPVDSGGRRGWPSSSVTAERAGHTPSRRGEPRGPTWKPRRREFQEGRARLSRLPPAAWPGGQQSGRHPARALLGDPLHADPSREGEPPARRWPEPRGGLLTQLPKSILRGDVQRPPRQQAGGPRLMVTPGVHPKGRGGPASEVPCRSVVARVPGPRWSPRGGLVTGCRPPGGLRISVRGHLLDRDHGSALVLGSASLGSASSGPGGPEAESELDPDAPFWGVTAWWRGSQGWLGTGVAWTWSVRAGGRGPVGGFAQGGPGAQVLEHSARGPGCPRGPRGRPHPPPWGASR